jgi:rubrerythrin
MNCGQRVGGTVLLTEQEEQSQSAGNTPWWQISESSVIPPPPQVREQIARQEAAQREQARIVEEQQKFQERLEEERHRSAERLAAIRERRQARVEESTKANPTDVKTAAINCHKCGSTLNQAGHTFSFCLHCGADVSGKNRTTASAKPRNVSLAGPEEKVQTRQSTRNVGANVTLRVNTQSSGQSRSDVNPAFPAIMSLFFPGIGQFMNGQPTKGVLLLLALFVLAVVFHVNGLLLWLGHGLAALDAYSIARRRRDGWAVREDEWDFGG